MAKTFNGTAGNDVLNYTLSSAKIQALGGNDIIGSYGNNVTIDGGAGSDNIAIGMNFSDASSGKNVTVTGGTGVDYITSTTDRGVLFQYKSGDGIDFINGFNSKDTLQITGSNYSTMTSGNDFIVSVGTGYVVLTNFSIIPVKIKDASGKLTTYNKNPSYVLFGTDYDDVITNTSKNSTVLGYAGNDTKTLSRTSPTTTCCK